MTADELARDFWIQRARSLDPVTAVHPDSRWIAYDAWTRRMIQRWTFGRLRALAPRYRRCIDLGCGFGDWTEQLAAMSDEIHACDLSPDFAATTQRRLARHRAAHIACADVRTFPLPRDADLIYVGAVLMYLRDIDVRAMLRRIGDAARPGAVIVIRDFCAFNLGKRATNRTATSFDVHRRPAELRAMAERAGLSCVE